MARRRSFLRQMTEVGLGIGAAGIQNALKKTKTPGISPFTSTLLEAALIAAILIETSAMAYFNREKLVNFLQTIATTPKIEQVTPPPGIPTSREVQSISSSAAVTSTFASATLVTEPAVIVLTTTGTPIPGNTLAVNQLSATPDPKVNNGNHYGQTPKPERTKENNGNNGNNDNNGNNGNNDKDPKPTKDK